MKISHKFHLFSITILLVMTIAVIVAGSLIISELVYRLQGQVLNSELDKIRQTVFEALNRSGVRAAAQAAAVVQANLPKAPLAIKTGHLFIIETPDRVVFHEDYQFGEPFKWSELPTLFQQQRGTIEYTYQGVSHYAVFTTVHPIKWLICLSIEKAEMFAKRMEYLRNIGFIAAVILGISAFVVSLFVGRFLRRIQSTLDCVQQIENGGVDTRIHPIMVKDEVGRLQAGINAMSVRIKARTIEQQQAEHALRESESRYRSLFQDSPISLWEEDFSRIKIYLDDLKASGITDFRSYFATHPDAVAHCAGLVRVMDVNQATLDLLKAEHKDALLAGLPTIFTPESLSVFREQLITLAGGGLRFESEAVQLALTGEEKQVALQLSVAPGHAASLGKVLVSLVDITERRQAEEILKKHHDHMEVLVAERTTELAAAKEQAEAVSRAKSIYLANMSHELRTPLNAVLGFSQLMRNTAGITREQMENLDIITRSGEHLLTLINTVLDISKIEAGRVELEVSPLDLHQLMQEMKSMMAMRAHEHGLDFTLEKSLDLPRHIRVDGGKLRQVLINLLGNAIQYTIRGGVILRAVAAPGDTPDRMRVRFEVEDTGPGIRTEAQAQIFAPFVQLDDRAPTEGGTGLGLAISKQFVELMGGSIGVASEPGKGAVFHIEIPAPVVAPEAVSTEPRRGRVIGLAPGQGRHRLLIVDDQPDSRLLLRKLLEPLGVELREAANGKEALAVVGAWQPHLIWMDIRMPVMDGLEATRHIRALELKAQSSKEKTEGKGLKAEKSTELSAISRQLSARSERVPIVAVTAHALEEERREILAAGCDDFIRKPYRDADIHVALARNLGVRFEYEAQPPGAHDTLPLSLSDLTGLPAALVSDLEQALVRIDIQGVKRAIEAIRPFHEEVAAALEPLARDLQFGRILRMIRTAGSRTGQQTKDA